MVYGILFTTLLSVRLDPGFKPLLRRSRMSFPAGLLACFCCVIFLVLVSMFLRCLLRSIRSRFESPSRPSRISQRHKFFSPEQASRCHQSAVRIPVSPSRTLQRHKFFSVLRDDIFGPPRLEPPSPRAICPRSSQLSLAATVPFLAGWKPLRGHRVGIEPTRHVSGKSPSSRLVERLRPLDRSGTP